ncbi:hypothetical protein SLS62_007281 [Diatrype stigma]|uniref:Uncharacterized protein n=1 Tax=Diatrype stigma TaxID=117547 RepID=A0AAN9UR23_9PEZI
MRLFQTAIAPLLAAAVATAAPALRHVTEDPSFLISLTFEDGTTSGIFKVADSLEETALSYNKTTSFVFMDYEDFTFPAGPTGKCTFLEPDRQGLGTLQVNKATTVPVNPLSVIGFVQCNVV